jgi:two-component system chemotaxis sensor kinase CheA
MTAQEQQIQSEIARLAEAPASAESGAAPNIEMAIETTLARIAELASGTHPQAASVATELLGQIRASAGSGEAATDPLLKSGLIRLQEVFRQETGEKSPADAASGQAKVAEPPRESATTPAAASCALEDDPELIGDLVVEAREHLSSAETHLLALEKDPSLLDAVHSVFRSFHTIKGLAGFLALGRIQAVAHETETILSHAREKRISISPQLIDITLKAADYIRAGLDALSSKPPREAMESLPSNEGLLNEITAAAAYFLSRAQSVEETVCEETGAAGPSPAAKGSDGNVVRIDTEKLEYLVEMVGELVIAQSLIHFDPAADTAAVGGLSRNFAHLGRVTGEIQKTVLSMRMVPISRLYDKMARLVRDLGRKSGKRIEMRRIGDQVELDRNIVEEITDPFVHMIRNSVDHGIEDAETRAASGKSETAFVTLEAFHQAGYIILRMSDDGRGLRADKILQKAVERGLVAPDAKLDEQSIYKLIFEPGFSTAERVTDISGRGVGMDVVRRQIEKLRGTIEITSRPGLGCTFSLKLPLTLAMVDGLILESGGERYVLPIYSVREMFHVTTEKLFTVENRAEMILLRGSLLPVVRLDRFFANLRQGEGSGEIGIVVEGRTRQFCLIVDRMVGKQEVVIKALGPSFKNVRGVAGGAILGDGRVGLILDVHGIDGGDTSET